MITLTREEAQQVLETLDYLDVWDNRVGKHKEQAIETLRAKLSEPEPEPVAWLITDEMINSLQVDSIQRLIDRARHAHMTDIKLRINGQDEWHQADWIKHMKRAVPQQRELVGEGQALSEMLKRMADNAIMVAGNGHIDCDSNARRVLFAEIDNLCAVFDTPSQREWVGLTDDERDEIREQAHYEFDDISNAIEAKLKEKNA